MKYALVTGGTRGIGLACAERFQAAGYAVSALYSSDEESAERARSRLPSVRFLKADVSSEDDVVRAIGTLPALDALVCNAGIAHFAQVQDTSLSDWERVMAVNARGVFLCCKHAVPLLLKRGEGSIVALSSVWGETGGSCESTYSASKGAVIAFAKALAKELAPSRITVNCVSPGVIDTEMNARLSEEERRSLAEEIPLGRWGRAEEVAEVIFRLCEQKYVTGQDVAVNGGFYI